MSIATQIPDSIKRVTRAIGYAAWLDTPDEWLGLPVVLKARLRVETRAALAFASLKSLPHDTACLTFDAAVGIPPEQGAAQPIAPLYNHMDEAAFWADMAEPEALDAYCLASFNAMSAPRKSAFLGFVQGRQAA